MQQENLDLYNIIYANTKMLPCERQLRYYLSFIKFRSSLKFYIKIITHVNSVFSLIFRLNSHPYIYIKYNVCLDISVTHVFYI